MTPINRKRFPSRRWLFIETLERRNLMATLSGTVFVDSNIDGIQQATDDPLIPPVTVFLDTNLDGVLQSGEPSTTAIGTYSFLGLTAGTYSVRVVPPANFAESVINTPITLATPDTGTVNLGVYRQAEIHGYKFIDDNGNGIDNSDTRRGDVNFTLEWAGPDNSFVTTGDNTTFGASSLPSTGTFSFSNLNQGRYRLSESAPAGMVRTTASFPIFVVNASGQLFVPQSGFVSFDASIQSEIVTPSLAVGNFRLGEIRGYLFHDLDGNGVDNTEPRRAGVDFRLIGAGPDDDFSTIADNTLQTVTTLVSGTFAFVNLPRGIYQLEQILPTDGSITITTGGLGTFNVNTSGKLFQPTGFTVVGVDQTEFARPQLAVGNFRLGEIRGYKFVDRNAGGTDNGDPEQGGIQFELTNLGIDRIFGTTDDVVLPLVTSAIVTGEFSFGNLTPGTYRLRELTPADVLVTTAAFTDFVVNASGQLFVPAANFGIADSLQTRVVRPELARGNFRLGEIRGYKFIDNNGDGVDNGDPLFPNPGVTFQLTFAGPDNDFATTGDNTVTTQSTVNGSFAFLGLARGLYRLQEQLRPGFIRTTAPQTAFNINDSGILFVPTLTFVTPDNFQTVVTVRPELAVGNFRLGTITGYAFGDIGGDGIDTGRAEPRGGNALSVPPEAQELQITVQLRQGSVLVATTTTDGGTGASAGRYTFPDLTAGTYEVSVSSIVPNNRKLTTARVIGSLVVTSGSVYQPFTGLVTLDPFQTSIPNGSLAIGSAKKAVIKGIVFLDKDGNNIRNAATEPGMANFTVSLVGAGLDDNFGTGDDLVFAPIITNSSGLYEFNVDARNPDVALTATPDLLAGRFRITLTEPLHYTRGTGTTPGTETRNIANVSLNDILFGTGVTATQTPNADQTTQVRDNLNFAASRYAAVYGIAFNDLDVDGTKDPGEPVIANQRFRITGALPGFVPRETSSDAAGRFSFDDLPGDTYTVSQILETTTANGVVQETQGRTTLTFSQLLQLNNIYVAPEVPDPRLSFEVPPASEIPPLPRISLNPLAALNFGRVQLSTVEGNVYRTVANLKPTKATWSNGLVTVLVANSLSSGQLVTLAEWGPASLNGTFAIVNATGNAFRIALALDPGVIGNPGKASVVTRQPGVDVSLLRVEKEYLQDELARNRTLTTDSAGKYTFYAWPGKYEIAEAVPTGFDPYSPRLRYSDYGLINITNISNSIEVSSRPRWTEVISLENDGLQNDIVVANEYLDRSISNPSPLSGGIRVYRNVGTPGASVEEIDLGVNSRPSFVTAFNLDSDPENELIVTTSGLGIAPPPNGPFDLAYGDVVILDQRGGKFVPIDPTTGVELATKGNRSRAVNKSIAGDGPRHVSVVRANGKVTLVVTNERVFDPKTNIHVKHFEDISIATQVGSNPFLFKKTAVLDLSNTFESAETLFTTIGDFNNDGTEDIAVPQGRFSKIDFFKLDGTRAANLPGILGVGKPVHVLTANVIGDANDDLVVSDYVGNNILVFEQKNGSLRPPVASPTRGKPTVMAAALIDSDQNFDISVATLSDGSVQTLINTGTGRFLPRQELANFAKSLPGAQAPLISTQQVAFGDFNADGMADLVMTHFSGGVSLHPSAVIKAATWTGLNPQVEIGKGIALPDNRQIPDSPLGGAVIVMPLARPLITPNLAYPVTSALPNKGGWVVPSGFGFASPLATLRPPEQVNVRTAPQPLTLERRLQDDVVDMDVNGNGQIEPLDALLVINAINNFSGGDNNSMDVSGDGVVSPLDVLLVVNQINLTASSIGIEVNRAQIQSALEAAIERFELAGAGDLVLSQLSSIPISIQDLPGDTLSWVAGDSLVVDLDAAGRGWFVDLSPREDSEFLDGRSVAGVDLLSVLAHEIGHLLGLEDREDGEDADIMNAHLRPGIRRLDANAVDQLLVDHS